MTTYDLRAAFARHYFRMSADEDDSAAGEDEGEGTDNDDNDNDNQDVDNPRLKQLSDEAGKYRRKMKEWRKRAEEAEAKVGDANAGETVRTLRLELAFERLATRAKITDFEAAWRLVEDDLKAVNINDDGVVDAERMQQIVDHVVERYPYLRDDYAPAKDSDGDPPSSPSGTSSGASGRPVNGRRRSDAGADFGALARKFPALRR